MKSSLSQPSLRNLFSEKSTTTERKEFKSKVFASIHTKVEIPSKSIPTLRRDLRFLTSSHSIHEKVFTAKYHKSGKRPRKRFSISFRNEKETWQQFFPRRQCFPEVMNNQSPNSGFLEISLRILNTIRVSKLGRRK